MLATESARPEHARLDTYDSAQLVCALLDDQHTAVRAVQSAQAALTAAVDAALPRLQAGGRLIYVGAGTSGRLGVLDSVELLPTFSWPAERAPALLAGGPAALLHAVEGAEDDAGQGATDLLAQTPVTQDVVILLAASGRTPYVLGAADAARNAGALTIGLANNSDTPLLARVDMPILLDTGGELIAGSTRLKAGSAQKMALNTLSSALMVRLHKVYGNLMVDVQPTNAKLRARAVALVAQLCGCATGPAQAALQATQWQVKPAVLIQRLGMSPAAAQARLLACAGNLRKAMGDCA